MLKVEDAVIRLMTPMHSMCLLREIYFNERQIMTVKLHVGFVGTCNLYGRQGSTQWCILQHDQTQPRTKAQRASKHSLGKN